MKITPEELEESKRNTREVERTRAAFNLAAATADMHRVKLAEKYDVPGNWVVVLDAGELADPRRFEQG